MPSNFNKDKALPERPPSGQSSTPQEEEPLVGRHYTDEEGVEYLVRQNTEDDVPAVPSLNTVRLPSTSGQDLNFSFEESSTDMSGVNSQEIKAVARGSSPSPTRQRFTSDSANYHDDPETRSSTAHESHSSEGQILVNDGQSTSWLDTIDESGASSPASTKLSLYLGGTHSHHASNGTEAEFDAALDAAVEAAYDEGLEPALNEQEDFYDDDDDYDDHRDDDYGHDDVVSNARRNIEIAKQRVREAEMEAQAVMARGLQQRLMMQDESSLVSTYNADADYIDEEAEEEERMLEEMTKGYVMDDFEFNLHTKTALPRQSDSSTVSGRTWGSSITSTSANSATAGTSLSTLAEEGILPGATMPTKRLPPIPKIPSGTTQQPIAPNMSPSAGVRARRFSGSNTKQLKIDTKRVTAGYEPTKKEPFSAQPAGPPSPVLKVEPKTSLPILTSSISKPLPTGPTEKKGSFDISAVGQRSASLTRIPTLEGDSVARSVQSSPPRTINKIISAPGMLRKNTSSSSLAGMRTRNMSVSTPDINESPNTPSSSYFPAFDFQRQLANGLVPAMPTPSGASFPLLTSKSLRLFDNDIHSPTTPGSPSSTITNAPIPLEPCPESFLLRPFWLMRCLYQTIAHPRGGYLSTKLFIPREVWHVKNVRIKAIEDKISLCDLLTAALLKVAQVDTYDADAVLEEMQTFENILDQVQTAFTKKLGNEVGVQGALPLFKNANIPEESQMSTENMASRSSSQSSRSVLTSWRKLRSKSSAAASASTTPSTYRESGKSSLNMSTLPMTASPPSGRFTKRDVTQLQLTGPNANFMGALARLFDAAQVLGKSILVRHLCKD